MGSWGGGCPMEWLVTGHRLSELSNTAAEKALQALKKILSYLVM